MVELLINGRAVELTLKGQEIKYNKQIADVFDIASVSVSYTNSFNVPKTPNNTQIFESLGIVGDQSTIPYSQVTVSLKENGFDLIRSGWLNVSETTDVYKCSITDGMVDFFKEIENKTMGVDLDLSNFEHVKSMDAVIGSFDNEYYNYIIADFGGKTLIRQLFLSPHTSINIDYLTPSFSVKKLFELMFSTFGYTYFSEEMDLFLEELYITYPTPPLFEAVDEDIIATLTKNFWKSSQIVKLYENKYYVPTQRAWDSSVITEGELLTGDIIYQIAETSTYKIQIKNESYAAYNSISGTIFIGTIIEVYKNNDIILTFQSDPYAEVTKEINIFLQAGDKISYIMYALKSNSSGISIKEIRNNNTEMIVYKATQGDVLPSNAFQNFKIKDFFKELLYRTGLTPIADNVNKVITFIPISQRIDITNEIDWSDKYVQRKKESYLKSGYAQRNLFKMKYNEGDEITNDGVLLVNNRNIESEKTLAQSLMYSPIQGTTSFPPITGNSITTSILPMFTKELSRNEDDELIADYKSLDNRFYLIRRNTVTDRSWRLKSQIVPEEETVTELHFATTENTLLSQLIASNFSEYEKIFNNFRVHEIELALGLNDILSLDLTRPYYFKQEAGFYILNKLPYQKGETIIGEFVRINQ